MFVIEVVNLGAKQTKLSEALGISRQTIHNYRETYKYFGTEGLVYSYDPDVSKSLAKQRALHAEQLPVGNKYQCKINSTFMKISLYNFPQYLKVH